jgi:hypothetical protein
MFVPSVQRHLKNKHLEPKALLLLDNCPAHPPADSLISKDGRIRVMYLPKNTTALIQPLDQGIMYNFKVNYRWELLLSLLSSGCDVPEFLKLLTLKEVAYKIGLALDCISKETVQNCWRKCGFLRTAGGVNQTENSGEQKSTQCAIQCDLQAVRDVLDEQELAENLMEQWVDIDKEELVCDILTDENIVESITNEKGTKGSDAEIEDVEEEPVEVPTAWEALNGLDTVIG